MDTPSPTRPRNSSPCALLHGEVVLSGEELANATGITTVRLERLIHLGLVEPITPGANQFTAATAARLRRVLRLRADLGVRLVEAGIIVDLLDRLDSLEAELARLRTGSTS